MTGGARGHRLVWNRGAAGAASRATGPAAGSNSEGGGSAAIWGGGGEKPG